MQRRAFVSSLLGVGFASCANREDVPEQGSGQQPDSNATGDTTPATQIPSGSHSETATNTEYSCFSPRYLDIGEVYESREFAFSIRGFTARSPVTVAPAKEGSDEENYLEDLQILLIRLMIQNPEDKKKSFCAPHQKFGILYKKLFVSWCRTTFSVENHTINRNDFEGRDDLTLYPPDEPFEPNETREVQLGALAPQGYKPTTLRIGYDGPGRGFEIQWQKKSLDRTPSYGCG